MPCYHPLKRFNLGINPVTGKSLGKVTGYECDHVELREINGHIKYIAMPDSWRSSGCIEEYYDPQLIPCGQCLGCRIDKSREWANRMMLELKYHKESYFVTLTYNDEHLKFKETIDPDTGEIVQAATLYPRDLELFWKRLRKISGQEIRYYACGEYGPLNGRPHYHAIIFGLHLDDLKEVRHNVDNRGYSLFESEFLNKVWSDSDGQIGFVQVGQVTWETCAYTARYVTKKLQKLSSHEYSNFMLYPEFARMSRRPGLGRRYFEEHKDMYDTDSIHLALPNGGRSFKPPRYYDNLFDVDHHDELVSIKENRQTAAENAVAAKLMHTNLSYIELLEVEERNFKDRVKKLQRSRIE